MLPSFGTLRHVEMRVCSAGADGRPDAERDDVALEILPHALALAARLCAGADRVGRVALRRAAAGELLVDGTRGRRASVSVHVSMAGRPPVNQLQLVAERGSIHADLFHGFAYVERGSGSRASKITRPFYGRDAARGGRDAPTCFGARLRGEPAYPGLRELVSRFYAAVAGEAPNPIPAAETLAVAEVWARLVASGGQG